MGLEPESSNKVFGGWSRRYKVKSEACGCELPFTVFFPPQASASKPVPVLYYLSGLSCDDQNFTTKAGAQRVAAELGIALVAPDTSPRGLNVEGEGDAWDFGLSAGFYVDATRPKWKGWQMYTHVTRELPRVLAQFKELDTGRASIFGHSMGGHGALVLGLRNPEAYRSISAFAPICNPALPVPWGEKAFTGYLGEDRAAWKAYDATELARTYSGPQRDILVDVGTSDKFLEEQLKPDNLAAAVQGNSRLSLTLRKQDGYNHSYYFIATFVEDHIRHHAKALLGS